jgi:ABC-2 type transport system permease protein
MDAYLAATRYTLVEQARNKLALGLLVVFLPVWYYLLAATIAHGPAAFKLTATGQFLTVDAHDVTVLAAGANAIALICGFTIFAATRKGAAFDRRLVLCGLSQPLMLAAKLTALAAVALAVSVYSALVLLAFWRPENLALVWLGYFLVALVYGTFGLLLGVLVSSELAGFFLIIMVGLLDTFFQIPVENPAGNQPFLHFFPAHGPEQLAVAGGFAGQLPFSMVLLSFAWVAGFGLVGLLIFWLRTRAWNRRGRALATPPDAATPVAAG